MPTPRPSVPPSIFILPSPRPCLAPHEPEPRRGSPRGSWARDTMIYAWCVHADLLMRAHSIRYFFPRAPRRRRETRPEPSWNEERSSGGKRGSPAGGRGTNIRSRPTPRGGLEVRIIDQYRFECASGAGAFDSTGSRFSDVSLGNSISQSRPPSDSLPQSGLVHYRHTLSFKLLLKLSTSLFTTRFNVLFRISIRVPCSRYR